MVTVGELISSASWFLGHLSVIDSVFEKCPKKANLTECFSLCGAYNAGHGADKNAAFAPLNLISIVIRSKAHVCSISPGQFISNVQKEMSEQNLNQPKFFCRFGRGKCPKSLRQKDKDCRLG